MNNIQSLFFENLKQIFNAYNSFYEKIEQEKKLQLNEINKNLDSMKLKVYYLIIFMVQVQI